MLQNLLGLSASTLEPGWQRFLRLLRLVGVPVRPLAGYAVSCNLGFAIQQVIWLGGALVAPPHTQHFISTASTSRLRSTSGK